MQCAANPVAVLPSSGSYVVSGARSGTQRNFQKVTLCKGLKVMLRVNISVRHGLVNGLIGTVKHIVYHQTAPPQLPTAVLVHFPSYSGPTINGLVPIQKATFTENDNDHVTMINIPLIPAYALTFHKCQGQTLPSIFLSLGNKDHFLGATYVGMSRVARLTDMTISTIDPCRFRNAEDDHYRNREAFLAKLHHLHRQRSV